MANLLQPVSNTNLRRRWNLIIALTVLSIPLILLALDSKGLDFRAFYVAAKATAVHLNPYSDNQQFGQQLIDPTSKDGLSRWIYPPAALFFAAPLGALPFNTARLLFEFASIAALIWTLLFLRRRFDIPVQWLALSLISLPVVACIQRGQVDLLILFCIVLAYALSGRFWAGIPLGVAISIKIFPAALVLWWLLEKRYKEAATAVGFSIALSLLAAWHFGVGSYASFLHSLTTMHSQASPATYAGGPWLSLSPGFVGSYNNPLILLDNAGILMGFVLTVLVAFVLISRRVAPEVGFFAMALVSQIMNTTLWTMGMVMYIPICLVAISRLRSHAAWLLLIPLLLPSQIRIFGVTPRLVIALLVIGVFIAVQETRESVLVAIDQPAESSIRCA